MGPRLSKKILSAMKSHSPFYQSVWKACCEIPRGEVRTYGWIAKRVGNPKAARAVGRALSKNHFAPAVPCHRVVGANGRMTGYSGTGGMSRKRRMLRAEGVPV